MLSRISPVALLGIIFCASCVIAAGAGHARRAGDQDSGLEGGSVRALERARQAYDASQYARALDLLKNISAEPSQSAEVALWMMKSYYEMRQMDAAIASGEKAIELQPGSSESHMWLGRSYGRKAEKAGVFSSMSLAKKTRREFETAVRLDAANFEAQQDLVEYYCSAPGIMGGGEEKAAKQIAALAALDAAEAHFARAGCWSDHKNWARADAEFQVALRANQKRPFVVFEIADYFTTRRRPDLILEAADAGVKLSPGDSRAGFYRGVALVMKNEKLDEAESHLKTYLDKAPKRMAFPSYAEAHEWLGRLCEQQGHGEAAAKEYRAALETDPHNKAAREALKRLPH
jgi:tetratricopeptide (TPR) repeat protein